MIATPEIRLESGWNEEGTLLKEPLNAISKQYTHVHLPASRQRRSAALRVRLQGVAERLWMSCVYGLPTPPSSSAGHKERSSGVSKVA